MTIPFVSIIIPVKNVQNTLVKCLDSIRNLNYENFEVIVIDDGSTDKTAEILKSFKNIRVIKTDGIGPSGCRNLALKEAKGEFVAFTDGDCIVGKEWLNELLKGFLDKDIVGVGGIQESPQDETHFGRNVNDFFNSIGFIEYIKRGDVLKQVKHNASCNVMYRKQILQEMGGFLEGFWPGEDVELDRRINKKGYTLIFNPKAIVFHYRPNNFNNFSKMMFRYGKAQGWLAKKYGIFRTVHFVPIFTFILALLFMYNIFYGFFLLILIITSLFIKSLIKSKTPFLMLQFFLITIFFWNLGFLRGLFNKK